MWDVKAKYRRIFRAARIVSIILLAICGIIAMFCGIIELLDYRNITMLIIAVCILIASFAVLSAAYLSIQGMRYRVDITEEGISLIKGNKLERHLQWNEVRDAGIGHQATHFGKIETRYFADHILSEDEKEHLELLGGNSIYMIDMSDKERRIVELAGIKC